MQVLIVRNNANPQAIDASLLLAAYLVSAQAYGSLSPLNLLIFLITWLAPVWFLSGWVHRY